MGKCGGVLKFHSPVNGLSIKWCTCVSDWDAPREKLEALKKLNILKKLEISKKLDILKTLEILKKLETLKKLELLKKLETSRADEERQRRVLGGSPLDTD